MLYFLNSISIEYSLWKLLIHFFFIPFIGVSSYQLFCHISSQINLCTFPGLLILMNLRFTFYYPSRRERNFSFGNNFSKQINQFLKNSQLQVIYTQFPMMLLLHFTAWWCAQGQSIFYKEISPLDFWMFQW